METNSDRSGAQDDNTTPSLAEIARRVDRRREQAAPGSDSEGGEQASLAASSPAVSEFVFPADDKTNPIDEFGAEAKTDALVELFGDTPNLLLLGPDSAPGDYDLCSSLIGASGTDRVNLLLVTFTESPDTRLDVLEGHLGHLPENVAVLSVGGSTRSGSESSVAVPTSPEKSTAVETISNPSNIQRLGITISRYVGEWGDTDGETLVCFHSLTPLLHAVEDNRRVFRFLNTLFGRIQSANAHAHYHMDPDVHDKEVISTFRQMFDQIVTFDENGSFQIDHES